MSIKLFKKKNYQRLLLNLVTGKGGTYLFRNLFANVDGKVVDILDNGRLACATVVSNVLALANGFMGVQLVKTPHATVDSVEKDMIQCGWYNFVPGCLEMDWAEIRPLMKNKLGAVIVWEKQFDENDGKEHRHIGFYADDDLAISNDAKLYRAPVKHHVTFGTQDDRTFRRIEKIYWHSGLDQE